MTNDNPEHPFQPRYSMSSGNLRNGVTLVELVVALALSSLLLAALTGVLKTLSNQAKRSAQARILDTDHAIESILWHDLSQSHGVALTDGTLWMLIPGVSPVLASGDDIRGKPLSQTVNAQNHVVAYQMLPMSKTTFSLVRRTYAGSSRTCNPIFQQTLAWDVEKVAFERIDENGQPQPLPRQIGPTPAAMAYRIAFPGDVQPITTRVYAR